MRIHLEKIGSVGAVIAAAACPICFPKLALLGALFGLGALGSEPLIYSGLAVLVAASATDFWSRMRARRLARAD